MIVHYLELEGGVFFKVSSIFPSVSSPVVFQFNLYMPSVSVGRTYQRDSMLPLVPVTKMNVP